MVRDGSLIIQRTRPKERNLTVLEGHCNVSGNWCQPQYFRTRSIHHRSGQQTSRLKMNQFSAYFGNYNHFICEWVELLGNYSFTQCLVVVMKSTSSWAMKDQLTSYSVLFWVCVEERNWRSRESDLVASFIVDEKKIDISLLKTMVFQWIPSLFFLSLSLNVKRSLRLISCLIMQWILKA